VAGHDGTPSPWRGEARGGGGGQGCCHPVTEAEPTDLHPAPSIILFTTASGAGYGLLLVLALGLLDGVVPPERALGTLGLGLAVALITGGLFASTLHLGHPERAWRAVSQWRSSWLSREGVAALLTYLPVLVLVLGWMVLGETGGIFALAAFLAAVGAVVTVWCTGMIYASLPPVREWRQPLVPWIYLAFALMGGAVLAHALLAAFGAQRLWAGVLAIVAAALAFGLKLAYWLAIDRAKGGPTVESATGLGGLGRVRQLDPPHTQTNYLLTEMAFRVARKHTRRLRALALVLGLGGGIGLTALALALPGLPAALVALLAALAVLAATAVERWLFFAEATHTVTLYYGDRRSER
jgi:sulfite dehydrogenase (quinone) subunit SoeC